MSVATVSYVVNGTKGVSAATALRVTEAIESTGYTPNAVARSLKRATSDSIGLVTSNVSNAYFAEVIDGIEQAAEEAGLRLLLGNSAGDPQRELRRVQALVQSQVDGIVVAPAVGFEEVAFPYLERRSTPVVLIDRLSPVQFDQVGLANEEPTRRLVTHLVELGHRRIGMVAGILGNNNTDERVDGYHASLGAAGIAVTPDLVRGGLSRASEAADVVREMLELAEPPTAIVASENTMAIGALKALHALGVRVPEDVAVVSFDDFEWAELLPAPLTTVAQPANQVGREAIRLLLRRLEDPGAERQVVRLEPTIIHRASCGCEHGDGAISVSL